MQLHEMEEQLKNIDARTTKIEQFLPTLPTRQDLRNEVAKLATKDDLRLTTDALQHEMAQLATRDELTAGLEDAKRYTLLLIQTTRSEIRQIREQMANKRDLQQLQRTLSKQIATLRAPGRKKQ